MKTGYQIAELVRQNPKKVVEFEQFQEHMKNGMPEITADPIGKFRLKTALKNQFGKHYTHHPIARQMMEHFERQMKVIKKVG